MFKRSIQKTWCHMVNGLAFIMPPEPICNRIRPLIYRLIGLKCHLSTSISTLAYLHPGRLAVGRNCFINQGVFFDLTSPVSIGDNVVIGLQTSFITAHHEIGDQHRRCGPASGRPIMVEDGAWIGARVTILGGVTIGKGSLVAAGALVNKDVPSNTMVAGVPARHVKALE